MQIKKNKNNTVSTTNFRMVVFLFLSTDINAASSGKLLFTSAK